ncbi:cyclic nucleotide-binding domain-containing protein [bacterium]|nr:cyclic nucleotide-binding domain-containing protein [bacterium]
MEKMVKNGLKLTFRAGQILFYEGHEPNGAFFILSGKVLLKKAPRRKQKMMDAPVWLGFEHVIDGSLYCVTAEAIDKVEAIFIPRKVVLNHMGISEATFTSLVE